jgi:hypothetical protein
MNKLRLILETVNGGQTEIATIPLPSGISGSPVTNDPGKVLAVSSPDTAAPAAACPASAPRRDRRSLRSKRLKVLQVNAWEYGRYRDQYPDRQPRPVLAGQEFPSITAANQHLDLPRGTLAVRLSLARRYQGRRSISVHGVTLARAEDREGRRL